MAADNNHNRFVPPQCRHDPDANFQIFYELMSHRVREILLILSPYDAFIMEGEGSFASRLMNEYHGLNLSNPPRITRVSCAGEALSLMGENRFDLVITTPQVEDMDCYEMAREMKVKYPDLPVILLSHNLKAIDLAIDQGRDNELDNSYIWSSDPDLLLGLVKNVEDHWNAPTDTQKALVRVIILVEDSPEYRSFFLPVIYRVVVKQTQDIMDESLTEEHRLLKMRARPKILVAKNFEQALLLYHRYRHSLLGIISDTEFPRQGKLDKAAGVKFFTHVRSEMHDLPLLMISSVSENEKNADSIPAVFLNKNSADLSDRIHDFFTFHLGFGDFIFRLPDGAQIDHARNLTDFEKKLQRVPTESLLYHAHNNHFFNWIMARSEVDLASRLHKERIPEAMTPEEIRSFLVSEVNALRRWRQHGVVAKFSASDFDPEMMDFVKIGNGSMGGKASGLAFMARQLKENVSLCDKFADIHIAIPKTCVITTDGFDAFVRENDLSYLKTEHSDEMIKDAFVQATLPSWLENDLESYLKRVHVPLTVRSSSTLEDTQFRPYAGLFETYMIPNNHSGLNVRLHQLITAVKLVYASSFFRAPKLFSQASSHRAGKDSMAVIIQEVVGDEEGDFYYPAISGVAKSYNFYPISPMKNEDGIAQLALGFGKTVVEGEISLSFSPKYPNVMPQFSTVDDILRNSQRTFYALRIKGYPDKLHFERYSNLEKRDVSEAANEFAVQLLSSTYVPDEHRIRDSHAGSGQKILTFARMLKYRLMPISEILTELLIIGHKGMGCEIEIEFAVNLSRDQNRNGFFLLQIRPIVVGAERFDVRITDREMGKAFCYSNQALGHGRIDTIADIVYIDPSCIESGETLAVTKEIGKLNSLLMQEKRPYLLIGPGRWGTADRWLGIPVQWQDIAGAKAIIELRTSKLRAEPSQGTHFFQNITSLGIHYITVNDEDNDHFLDWQWLAKQDHLPTSGRLSHVRLDKAFILKTDSATGNSVMYYD